MTLLETLNPKNVAKDFHIGDTHVVIITDYVRPKEEVGEIIRKVTRDAQRALAAQAAREQFTADEAAAS